jgi:hypothetical protein
MRADDLDGISVSPDGKVIALVTGEGLLSLIEWENDRRRELRLTKTGPHTNVERFRCNPLSVQFSKDVDVVLVSGVHGNLPLSIFDVATGKLKYSLNELVSAAALSADGTILAVCPDDDQTDNRDTTVRLIEVATGIERAKHRVPSPGPCRWVAISPDKKRISVGGPSRSVVLNVESGRVEIEVPDGVRDGRFGSDGLTLVARGWHRLRRWDLATGCEIDERPHLTWPGSLAYSARRGLLAVSEPGQSRVALWDVASARLVRSINLGFGIAETAEVGFAENDDKVVLHHAGRYLVEYEIKSATAGSKVGLQGMSSEIGRETQSPRIAANGRTMLAFLSVDNPAATPKHQVVVWETRSGRVLGRHAIPSLNSADESASTPDLTLLAACVSDGTRVIDLQTGLSVAQMTARGQCALSDDGTLLAVFDDRKVKPDSRLHVYEVVSGRLLYSITTSVSFRRQFCFVLPLRALLVSDGPNLRIIDVLSGEERGRMRVRDGDDSFRPGSDPADMWPINHGRDVLIRSAGGPALVWDLRPFALTTPAPAPFKAADLVSLWNELQADDPTRGQAAIWSLANGRALDVTAFLNERLVPVRDPTEKNIRQWLSDLSNPSFAKREAAVQALEQVGRGLGPLLKDELARTNSAETRDRLEKLWARIAESKTSGEQLRVARAITILERLNSPEARGLLRDLAGGNAYSMTTILAKSALARVD